MSKQRTLDLRGEALNSLWNLLPEEARKDAITIWARLIAKAAQLPSNKGAGK